MKNIRLACMNCDRDDYDFISSAKLARAVAGGWKHVDRVQSFQDACSEVAPGDDGVFDWWTHLGWCPDCKV